MKKLLAVSGPELESAAHLADRISWFLLSDRVTRPVQLAAIVILLAIVKRITGTDLRALCDEAEKWLNQDAKAERVCA